MTTSAIASVAITTPPCHPMVTAARPVAFAAAAFAAAAGAAAAVALSVALAAAAKAPRSDMAAAGVGWGGGAWRRACDEPQTAQRSGWRAAPPHRSRGRRRGHAARPASVACPQAPWGGVPRPGPPLKGLVAGQTAPHLRALEASPVPGCCWLLGDIRGGAVVAEGGAETEIVGENAGRASKNGAAGRN